MQPIMAVSGLASVACDRERRGSRGHCPAVVKMGSFIFSMTEFERVRPRGLSSHSSGRERRRLQETTRTSVAASEPVCPPLPSSRVDQCPGHTHRSIDSGTSPSPSPSPTAITQHFHHLWSVATASCLPTPEFHLSAAPGSSS